jgi:hypothetical protein
MISNLPIPMSVIDCGGWRSSPTHSAIPERIFCPVQFPFHWHCNSIESAFADMDWG